MNQHIKEYLLKHRALISQKHFFDLFDHNNLVYPYTAYKDEILKMLQDAGLIEQDEFYLEKINQFSLNVAKRINEFIEKEYGDKLKNPVGSIKEFTLVHSLPKLSVVMNDPGTHSKPIDQNIVWWIDRGYLKGSMKLENGLIKTESKDIYTYTPFKELLQDFKKCEDDAVEKIKQLINQGFETVEKTLIGAQETSKTVEAFVSSTVSILEKQLVENNYSNIDVSYTAEDISTYKITIKLKAIKKKLTATVNEYSISGNTPEKLAEELLNRTKEKLSADPNAPKPLSYAAIKQVLLKYGIDPMFHYTNKYTNTTTYKMQGGVGSLVGQDDILDNIHDDLTNLGFIVNSVTMEDSMTRRGSVPTLYIRVDNK